MLDSYEITNFWWASTLQRATNEGRKHHLGPPMALWHRCQSIWHEKHMLLHVQREEGDMAPIYNGAFNRQAHIDFPLTLHHWRKIIQEGANKWRQLLFSSDSQFNGEAPNKPTSWSYIGPRQLCRCFPRRATRCSTIHLVFEPHTILGALLAGSRTPTLGIHPRKPQPMHHANAISA